MNAQSPFTVKDAAVYRGLEAAPLAFAEWPEAIRAKLLSGKLWVRSYDELCDAPYQVGPLIPGYDGPDYAICRHSTLGKSFRAYVNVPLCRDCDGPCPDGVCEDCSPPAHPNITREKDHE